MTNPTATVRRIALCAGTVVALLAAEPSYATVVTDPANDFIPTFVGTRSGDLDVLSASATFDGTTFHIGATLNGNVGTLPTSLYVFGFNRGAGTSSFAAIQLPNVIFDSVITLTGAGVTGGRDLVTNTALTLPAGAARISGASFTIDVPLSLLPSQGFSPLQYQVNLWPRDASALAGNGQIADFAPDARDFPVSAVPEPWSISPIVAGLLAMAGWRKRRSRLLR